MGISDHSYGREFVRSDTEVTLCALDLLTCRGVPILLAIRRMYLFMYVSTN